MFGVSSDIGYYSYEVSWENYNWFKFNMQTGILVKLIREITVKIVRRVIVHVF